VTEFVTGPGPGAERRRLTVSGEVDIAMVDDFLGAAQRCLDDPGDVIEIDLGGVTFIDSSGLGALVRIRSAAHDRNQEVVLTNVPPAVDRLFEVTGLTGIFDVRSDG
jgi:anti-sigma B factor antagonist